MERRNLDILSVVIVAGGLLLAAVLAVIYCQSNPQATNAAVSQSTGNGSGNAQSTEQQKLDLDRAIATANQETAGSTWALVVVSSFAAVFQVGAIVIACYAAWAASRSANAAQEAIKTASQNAQRELRAYMVVGRLWCEIPMRSSPHSIHMCFINTGQTPAYDFTCKLYDWSGRNKWPPDLPKGDSLTAPTQMICGPGQEVPCGGVSGPLGEVTWGQIDDKNLNLWVFGTAIYRDIFHQWYELKFCFYVKGYGKDQFTRMFAAYDRENEEVKLPGKPLNEMVAREMGIAPYEATSDKTK